MLRELNVSPYAWVHAVTGKKNDVLNILLESKANINANFSGVTALHLAVTWKNEQLVKFLLDKGADTEVRDRIGWTPLFFSVSYNSEPIFDLLLNSGANVNVKSYAGEYLIQFASIRKQDSIVKKLIQKGAVLEQFPRMLLLPLSDHLVVRYAQKMNPANAKANDLNVSLLHRAIARKNHVFVEALIEKGNHLTCQDLNGDTPLSLSLIYEFESATAMLLSKGVNVNKKNTFGKSPLHIAVEGRSETIVKSLLLKGAQLDSKDVYGQTPLHIASISPNSSCESVINMLLSWGADVNARDNMGNTPLILALISNNYDIASVLLDWGASLDIPGVSKEVLGKICALQEVKLILKQHWIKRKYVNLELNLDYLPSSLKSDIENVCGMDEFVRICLHEVDRLKSYTFGHNSMYDVFYSDQYLNILTYKLLPHLISLFNTVNVFPVYGHLVKGTINKFTQKSFVLDFALDIIVFPLPVEMSLKILNYLDYGDLINIINAR